MMAAALLCAMESIAQKKEVKKESTAAAAPIADTAKAGTVKPYDKVITAKAVTRCGMFTVHKLGESYYLEIPDTLLGRELLMVTRIAKAPVDGPLTGVMRQELGYYAGDEIDERVISFEKGQGDKLFVRGRSYLLHSSDSSADGMYRSVLNSNVQPILAALPVKAYNEQHPATVVEITDLLADDNNLFSCSVESKNSFKLGALLRDRSYTQYLKTFSGNLEIRTVKTYAAKEAGNDPLTFELNNSLVLLPKTPMLARHADERVGYFGAGYIDFDARSQGVDQTIMITRWRLEPKEEDRQKYFRGELVEPKKPIIYYIDPATPKKWVPYLIQGVNDWQVAFEQAGFKNAIMAKEAPTDDSTWSLEDASHSAIVYKPSAVANASGPHVHDPRTGEILESHINWYHNVMKLVHDWYMIQAATIDPRARKMQFSDELMGQLIRFVSSHEIGHTLGLMHNFGSSSTVPVDSLRSKSWVEKYGHTPSIMDYARFNYVAQPEDNIGEKGIYPRINDYDKWAIEWGYRIFPGIKAPDDEKALLNKWVIDSLTHNHRLWYGPQSIFGPPADPRSQNEDLGDDAMKAGSYGIKNLQRILPQLPEWTRKPNEGYRDLEAMYKALLGQYKRYAVHVATNIGGLYIENLKVEEKGEVLTPLPVDKQKRALAWLNEEVFKEPVWLQYAPVLNKFLSFNLVTNAGRDILSYVLKSRMGLLIMAANRYGEKNVYACPAFLNDLKKCIWSEIDSHKPITGYRKILQNTYVDILAGIVAPPEPKEGNSRPPEALEMQLLVRGHITVLRNAIRAAIPVTTDATTKLHLQWMAEKIDRALNPEK